MKRLILAVPVVVVLVACSSSTKPAAPSSTSSTPTSSSALSTSASPTTSAAVTPAPPPVPTPTIGKPYQVGTDSGELAVTLGVPLAPVTDPDTDGTIYYEVGFPITLTPISGPPSLDLPDLKLAPSGDDPLEGATDQDPSVPLTGQDGAAQKLACGSVPLLQDLLSSDSPVGTPLTKPLFGCVTFNYKITPTSFVFDVGLDTGNPSWPISLGTPRAAPVAQKLVSFSGSGSRLLTVPVAAQVDGTQVCWHMPHNGLNIIQSENDSAGHGLNLLVNAVGAVSDCATDESLGTYIQVLSDGSWSITVTNF